MNNLFKKSGTKAKSQTRIIMMLIALASIAIFQTAGSSCDIVSGDLIFNNREISWNIKNCGDKPLIICSISLKWPVENGDLLAIHLDAPTIFNENQAPTAATINSSWLGQESKRTIGPGQTSALRLSFRNPASEIASNYDIIVNYCPCIVEYHPSSSLECDIIGPNTICGNGMVWYNASMDEVQPYSYIYNWRLDSSAVGSGKSIQIEWSQFCSGNHTLYLNVTQIWDSMTQFRQCSKLVRVIKKPNVKITVIRM